MSPPLGIAALLTGSFRILFAHFGFLFPLAFVPALALAALSRVVVPAGIDPAAAGLTQPTASEIAFLLANVLAGFVVAGVLCLAALDALLGKRHSLRDYLAQTLRHIGPIVALGLLVSVATGLGMLFLLLPGLYLLARYLPWTPAVVFENAGWSGLARAQDLTAGYRWPLVGAAALLGLALAALVLALAPIMSGAAGGGIVGGIVEGVFAGFYYALISVFTAIAYLRLREIKEGMSAADIADTIG